MTVLAEIRAANSSSYDELGRLMFDAIHCRSSPYTQAQRMAWCPKPRAGPSWFQRLDSQTVLMARTEGELRGFMSLADGGYIDFAYIRPSAQGSGLFRRLYEAIEQIASQRAQPRLWVHASLAAQPAFGAMGFLIVRKESVQIDSQTLDRFLMEKHLTASCS